MKTERINPQNRKNGVILLIAGVAITLFLIMSVFIKIPVDSGANFVILSSLLGIIIFHKLYLLIIYILMALGFIIYGILRMKNISLKFG